VKSIEVLLLVFPVFFRFDVESDDDEDVHEVEGAASGDDGGLYGF
jgi:hypothetical protein